MYQWYFTSAAAEWSQSEWYNPCFCWWNSWARHEWRCISYYVCFNIWLAKETTDYNYKIFFWFHFYRLPINCLEGSSSTPSRFEIGFNECHSKCWAFLQLLWRSTNISHSCKLKNLSSFMSTLICEQIILVCSKLCQSFWTFTSSPIAFYFSSLAASLLVVAHNISPNHAMLPLILVTIQLPASCIYILVFFYLVTWELHLGFILCSACKIKTNSCKFFSIWFNCIWIL